MRMHKIMGRAVAAMLATILPLVGLTGCHGAATRSDFAVPDVFSDDEEIELTFWAKNDTNKTQTAIYQKAITDFEALYPNVTVNMRLYTDYGKIYNDVITNISTGTTPNVCITYPDHIATYLTGSNVVVPMDELMADPEYGLGGSALRFDSPKKSEIVPQFLKECSLSGHTYALPYMRSTEALYINEDYVEALGYEIPDVPTWDWIWEVSEAATEKKADGTYALNGQKVMIPFIYKSTDNMMIQYLAQSGAGYSTADGGIEIFNDTTSEFLQTIAAHTATGAFSTFAISGYPANFLDAGQCVFAVDSTAGATWMGAKAPLSDISADQRVDFKTAVRCVPQVDAENPRMISQGPSVCIFNKEDPQVVMASWLFAQFLLTNDVQTAYAETEGYLPVTTKAQESEKYRTYLAAAGEDESAHYDVKIAASKLLLANTQHTFTTPVFNGSTSLRNAAGQLIEDVVKSTRRKQAVDEAFLTKEYSQVTSLYRLNQISSAAAKNAAESAKNEARDLGPLPGTAKAILILLGLSWVFIAAVYGARRLRGKKR
ncbi:multiple sugar transport system substrate-binding protein [Lachnospiraceae bacterium NK3A20]|nr:multiple sugar transport system substrate-binding protein [Lachnospiraceae bacterium NK3A20]